MDPLGVVPVFLQQGREEVDGHEGNLTQPVGSHAHIADGDAHAKHLSHLELHVAADVIHFVLHDVRVTDEGGEFPSLVQTRTQETRDRRYKHLRCEEGGVEDCANFFNSFLFLS